MNDIEMPFLPQYMELLLTEYSHFLWSATERFNIGGECEVAPLHVTLENNYRWVPRDLGIEHVICHVI